LPVLLAFAFLNESGTTKRPGCISWAVVCFYSDTLGVSGQSVGRKGSLSENPRSHQNDGVVGFAPEDSTHCRPGPATTGHAETLDGRGRNPDHLDARTGGRRVRTARQPAREDGLSLRLPTASLASARNRDTAAFPIPTTIPSTNGRSEPRRRLASRQPGRLSHCHSLAAGDAEAHIHQTLVHRIAPTKCGVAKEILLS